MSTVRSAGVVALARAGLPATAVAVVNRSPEASGSDEYVDATSTYRIAEQFGPTMGKPLPWTKAWYGPEDQKGHNSPVDCVLLIFDNSQEADVAA